METSSQNNATPKVNTTVPESKISDILNTQGLTSNVETTKDAAIANSINLLSKSKTPDFSKINNSASPIINKYISDLNQSITSMMGESTSNKKETVDDPYLQNKIVFEQANRLIQEQNLKTVKNQRLQFKDYIQPLNPEYGNQDLLGFGNNLESVYGENESFLESTKKGAVGFFGNLGMSAAVALTNTPAMVSNVLKLVMDGKDNDSSDFLEALRGNTKLGEYLYEKNQEWQNENRMYKTDWAEAHPFLNMIPVYGDGGFADFAKSAGFMAGTILGSLPEMALISAATGPSGAFPEIANIVGKIARGISKFKPLVNFAELGLNVNNLRRIQNVDRALDYMHDIDLMTKAGKAAQKALSFGYYNFVRNMPEATIEAWETEKEMRTKLLDEYKNYYGVDAKGDDLKRIEKASAKGGNARYLGNLAVLAVTNSFWETPYLKGVADRAFGRQLGNYTLGVDAATAQVRVAEKTFRQIFKEAAVREAPSNALEEYMQSLIADASNSYTRSIYNTNGSGDLSTYMSHFNQSLEGAFETEKGVEALSGALQSLLFPFGPVITNKAKSMIDKDFEKNKELERSNLEKALNQGVNLEGVFMVNSLSGPLLNKTKEALAQMSISELFNEVSLNGDAVQQQHKSNDAFANFILGGIRQNQFDIRLAQIEALRDENLKLNYDLTMDQRNELADYLTEKAERLNEIHQTLPSAQTISKRIPEKLFNDLGKEGSLFVAQNYLDDLFMLRSKLELNKSDESVLQKALIIDGFDVGNYMEEYVLSEARQNQMKDLDMQLSQIDDTIKTYGSSPEIEELRNDIVAKQQEFEALEESLKQTPENQNRKKDTDKLRVLLAQKEKNRKTHGELKFVDDALKNSSKQDMEDFPFLEFLNTFVREKTGKVLSENEMANLVSAFSQLSITRQFQQKAAEMYYAMTTKKGIEKYYDDFVGDYALAFQKFELQKIAKAAEQQNKERIEKLKTQKDEIKRKILGTGNLSLLKKLLPDNDDEVLTAKAQRLYEIYLEKFPNGTIDEFEQFITEDWLNEHLLNLAYEEAEVEHKPKEEEEKTEEEISKEEEEKTDTNKAEAEAEKEATPQEEKTEEEKPETQTTEEQTTKEEKPKDEKPEETSKTDPETDPQQKPEPEPEPETEKPIQPEDTTDEIITPGSAGERFPGYNPFTFWMTAPRYLFESIVTTVEKNYPKSLQAKILARLNSSKGKALVRLVDRPANVPLPTDNKVPGTNIRFKTSVKQLEFRIDDKSDAPEGSVFARVSDPRTWFVMFDVNGTPTQFNLSNADFWAMLKQNPQLLGELFIVDESKRNGIVYRVEDVESFKRDYDNYVFLFNELTTNPDKQMSVDIQMTDIHLPTKFVDRDEITFNEFDLYLPEYSHRDEVVEIVEESDGTLNVLVYNKNGFIKSANYTEAQKELVDKVKAYYSEKKNKGFKPTRYYKTYNSIDQNKSEIKFWQVLADRVSSFEDIEQALLDMIAAKVKFDFLQKQENIDSDVLEEASFQYDKAKKALYIYGDENTYNDLLPFAKVENGKLTEAGFILRIKKKSDGRETVYKYKAEGKTEDNFIRSIIDSLTVAQIKERMTESKMIQEAIRLNVIVNTNDTSTKAYEAFRESQLNILSDNNLIQIFNFRKNLPELRTSSDFSSDYQTFKENAMVATQEFKTGVALNGIDEMIDDSNSNVGDENLSSKPAGETVVSNDSAATGQQIVESTLTATDLARRDVERAITLADAESTEEVKAVPVFQFGYTKEERDEDGNKISDVYLGVPLPVDEHLALFNQNKSGKSNFIQKLESVLKDIGIKLNLDLESFSHDLKRQLGIIFKNNKTRGMLMVDLLHETNPDSSMGSRIMKGDIKDPSYYNAKPFIFEKMKDGRVIQHGIAYINRSSGKVVGYKQTLVSSTLDFKVNNKYKSYVDSSDANMSIDEVMTNLLKRRIDNLTNPLLPYHLKRVELRRVAVQKKKTELGLSDKQYLSKEQLNEVYSEVDKNPELLEVYNKLRNEALGTGNEVLDSLLGIEPVSITQEPSPESKPEPEPVTTTEEKTNAQKSKPGPSTTVNTPTGSKAKINKRKLTKFTNLKIIYGDLSLPQIIEKHLKEC